jgi:chemotaxis protein CheC
MIGIGSNGKAIAGLQELFASATHDASAAMCRWTNGVISVTLDEVREVQLEEAATELALADEMLTMVVMTLDGELGGSLIMIFDDVNGRQLAASLLDRDVGTEPEWSELEKSALMETGNILGCAYVNALTRLIDRDLRPSAPYFVQDFGASVLQQALTSQAAASDSLLLCEIGFQRKGGTLDWRVVFVPTPGLQASLQRSLRAVPEDEQEISRHLDYTQ